MDQILALLVNFGPLVLMFLVLYLFMIKPQKKRDQQIREMRDSINVGDHIVTIGGVMGRVVAVRDDRITLETGADRVKIYFAKWAIQSKVDEVSE